eukprot:2123537-Rhodomonas_salina.1
MAGKVRGMPRPVRIACATKVNCTHCYEANAVRQDYPTASDLPLTAETELWQWDMLDMGKNYATINGNSYATIFLVKRTRFLMVFLHASKTGATIAGLMSKVRAKVGSWPMTMRSDGAAEYDSPKVRALFTANHINHEWSNAEQQHQDCAAETIVNMLGRAVHVQLLMSSMALEFWGLAMMNTVHIYNCLPHSALDWQVPYFVQTGCMPDVSWFRAFGCAAVVFQ